MITLLAILASVLLPLGQSNESARPEIGGTVT
jgi:hypothetical protein